MTNNMNIFREAAILLARGEKVVLATVAGASGSTPAGPSAKMLVRENGVDIVGTVGGGCLEAGAIQDSRIALHNMMQRIVEYELTDDNVDSGLICGGLAKVLIEPLDSGYLQVFQELANLQDDGRDTLLISGIMPGEKPSKTICPGPSFAGAGLPEDILIRLKEKGAEIMYSEKPETLTSDSGGVYLCEPVIGFPTLFIFGGGHVSSFIAQFAKLCAFRIVIIDDREKFSNPERFPVADDTVVSEYALAFQNLKILPSSFVVIVTRGHAYDECVLENVLNRGARYIGMIGSKRKVLLTMQHIEERGMPPEKLNSVFSPIGLDIDAKTPAEIGISVVAELIKVRRKGPDAPLRHMSDAVREIRNNLRIKKR